MKSSRTGPAIAATAAAHAKAETDWAERHPALARDERRLAQQNRAAARDYSHKRHGTAETHAAAARQRQGAVTRLYAGGHLTVDQLGAAAEIQAAAEAIGAGLAIRTVSLETRVDSSGQAGTRFWEALGAVRRELAFSRWRAAAVDALGSATLRLTLAIVTEDLALRPAAQRFRMRDASARERLREALNLWRRIHGQTVKEIDPASLAAAQAGLN